MGRDGGIGHIRNRVINVYILAISLLIQLCIIQNPPPRDAILSGYMSLSITVFKITLPRTFSQTYPIYIMPS